MSRSNLNQSRSVCNAFWYVILASGLERAAFGRAQHIGRLPLDGSLSLDAMEREILRQALERTQHNVTAAARLLGTTRQTLRYRVHKHGLRGIDGPGAGSGGSDGSAGSGQP